jgi:hypothetical protein
MERETSANHMLKGSSSKPDKMAEILGHTCSFKTPKCRIQGPDPKQHKNAGVSYTMKQKK